MKLLKPSWVSHNGKLVQESVVGPSWAFVVGGGEQIRRHDCGGRHLFDTCFSLRIYMQFNCGIRLFGVFDPKVERTYYSAVFDHYLNPDSLMFANISQLATQPPELRCPGFTKLTCQMTYFTSLFQSDTLTSPITFLSPVC